MRKSFLPQVPSEALWLPNRSQCDRQCSAANHIRPFSAQWCHTGDSALPPLTAPESVCKSVGWWRREERERDSSEGMSLSLSWHTHVKRSLWWFTLSRCVVLLAAESFIARAARSSWYCLQFIPSWIAWSSRTILQCIQKYKLLWPNQLESWFLLINSFNNSTMFVDIHTLKTQSCVLTCMYFIPCK